MNDAEKTDCPVCGAKSAMWHGEKDRVIAYKGHTRLIGRSGGGAMSVGKESSEKSPTPVTTQPFRPSSPAWMA
jgi:hypothetical protein